MKRPLAVHRLTRAALALVAGVAALLVVTFADAPRVEAQSVTQAPVQSATTRDPAAITFTLRTAAPGGVRTARLEYIVFNPDTEVGGGGDGTVTPGAELNATFTLQTNTAQRYIPIGSLLKYYWVLTNNDGSQTRTPQQDYLFLDGRYEWRSQQDGNATVYWYGTNDGVAVSALRAARAALVETEALLATRVPYDIRLIVYRNEDDGRAAKRPTSAAFDARIQTGGQRVAPDLVLVFDNSIDVVRHEVAHIVTHVAGDGPFAQIPSWLDEGTAVYAQTSPGEIYTTFGVDQAVRQNRTLSLRSIESPVSQPDQVNQFYGQSWSTVKYLIDTHGREKFAQLFRTVREGSRIDDALQKTYGVNQDGLYNAWRQSKGLQPIAVADRVTTNAPQATGTIAAMGIPQGGTVSGATPEAAGNAPTTSTTDAASEEGGSSTVAFAVLGGTILVAGLLGAAGFILLRRKPAATS